MKLIKGTLISNRYDIQSKIGSGGMAVVYKAIDRKLDRVVTLKIMREEHIEDEEFIERFNVEARAAARLNHPNIVKVYDVGRFQNIYYIVMEYIDGVTLKDLIISRGLFTNEEILGVAIQITSAIGHAHEHDIVHRDVKPQNILVTMDGEVKVTDFGIATVINAQTEELSENTIGSVHYFSPEQARGSNIDEKSDIYSIGITMFEMACGKPPFDDDTVVSIALKHINEPIPEITSFNPNVSKEVEEIIIKATQKARLNRFSSAEEMNNMLKRSLTHESGEKFTNSYDFSKTNTLHLSEEDVKKIKEEALNAFYSEGDTIFEYNDSSYDEKQDKVFKLAIITSVVILIIIALFFVKHFSEQMREVIEVPSFEGMTYDDALDEAYGLGFDIEIVKEEYSEEFEQGTIIQQDYEKGDTIYKDDSVKVSISLGSDKVEVPNVVGKTSEEASEEFSKLPFDVKEVYVYDELNPIDEIVDQFPDGGTKLSVGDEVTLYISRGEEDKMVVTPNVVGKSEGDAIASIKSRGLVLGETINSYSDTVEEGIVMSQTISPGEEVPPNTSMNIVVSLGVDPDKYEPEVEDNTDETEETETETETDTDTDTETETDNNTDTEDNTDVDSNTDVDNTETEDVIKNDVVTINTLYLPEGQDSTQVKMLEVTSDGTKIVFENTVSQSELPVQIPVSGTGVAEYQMYVKNQDDSYTLVASTVINFEESE